MIEYVYSLDGEQYYPCGRITKPKNLFKLAKKDFNIKDYLEDNKLYIYYGRKEEFTPCLFIEDILDLLRGQASFEVDDDCYLEDIEKEVEEELEEKLNKVLDNVVKKHKLKSNKFFVKDVVRFEMSNQGILLNEERVDD